MSANIDSDPALKSVISTIQACISSTKENLTLEQLQSDYELLNGGASIPYKQFNHNSVYSFLQAFPKSLTVFNQGGRTYVKGVTNEETKHIENLVSGQKTSKRPRIRPKISRKPVKSSWAPPKSTRSNYRPSRRSPFTNSGHPPPRHPSSFRRPPLLPNNFPPSQPNAFAPRPYAPAPRTYAPAPRTYAPAPRPLTVRPLFDSRFTENSYRSSNMYTSFENKKSSDNWSKSTSNQKMRPLMEEPQKIFTRAVNDAANNKDLREVLKERQQIESTKSTQNKVSSDYSQHKTTKNSSRSSIKSELESEAKKLGFGNLVYQNMKCGKKKMQWISRIKIGDKLLSSYPDEKNTELEAEEVVAKIALDHLKKSMPSYSIPVTNNYELAACRVRELLANNGTDVWWEHIREQYRMSYNEILDPNWITWCRSQSDIKVEEASPECYILGLPEENTFEQKDEKQEFPELKLPEEENWDVLVTHFKDCTELWFRLVGEYSEAYEDMITNIELHFMDKDNFRAVREVVLDRYYLCYSEDSWFRVQVKNVEGDDITVFCIDQGDFEVVKSSDLFPLLEQFRNLPPQAISACLAGLEDCLNDHEILGQAKDMIIGKSLVLVVHSKAPSLSVVLYDTTTAVDININEKLIELLPKFFEPEFPPEPSQSSMSGNELSEEYSQTNNEDLDSSSNNGNTFQIQAMESPKSSRWKNELSSDPSDIQDAGNEMKDLNDTLIMSTPKESEDECDVIGRHVTMQLRLLLAIDRIDAMDEIQAILSRYRKKALGTGIMYTSYNYSHDCASSPQPTVGFPPASTSTSGIGIPSPASEISPTS